MAHSQPEWCDRYRPRFEEYRLPEAAAERNALARQVGADGLTLLTAIDSTNAPVWLW